MTAITAPQPGTRTLNVLRTEIARTGVKNGKPWTMYRVHAEDETGTLVPELLHTFDQLPLGPVTVTTEARIVDGKIESYTLRDVNRKRQPKRHGGGGLESQVSDLQLQVANLTDELHALQRRFAAAVKADIFNPDNPEV